MSSLKGGRELRARLAAIRTVFKPVGKAWAQDFRDHAKPVVPVRQGQGPGTLPHPPGHLRGSIRVRNASKRKATVVADYWAYFVDKGPKPHAIPKVTRANPTGRKLLRFQVGGGQIVFAKRVRHPGYAGRPFRQRLAEDALRRTPMARMLLELWNRAGGQSRIRISG